jgi:hypothetical protein
MRQMMADRALSVPSAAEPGDEAECCVPSQIRPLLGRPAPVLVQQDAEGKIRDLGSRASKGPVMVVFYLSSTCMACVTHLVDLEEAMPRFRKRGAEVWAVCADSPDFSGNRCSSSCWFQNELGSPALPMIQGRQAPKPSLFCRGFLLAPDRKRAAFIECAGEPNTKLGHWRGLHQPTGSTGRLVRIPDTSARVGVIDRSSQGRRCARRCRRTEARKRKER